MTAPEPQRQVRTWQEELTATGDDLVARVRALVQEGNVRRVIITHEGHTLLELPLTLGVVGALLAPQVAALGALAALITRCILTIEREEPALPAETEAPTSPAPTDLDALAARYAVPARALHDLAARRRAGAHAEELISLLRQPDWGGLAPDQAAQLVADLPD
jgi:hypothetical protein